MSASEMRASRNTAPDSSSWPLSPEATLRFARLEVAQLVVLLAPTDDSVDLDELQAHARLAWFFSCAAQEVVRLRRNTNGGA